jgi:hypothetical protein
MELQDLWKRRKERCLCLAEKVFVLWATQSLLAIRLSNSKHCIRADLMRELLTPLAMPLRKLVERRSDISRWLSLPLKVHGTFI